MARRIRNKTETFIEFYRFLKTVIPNKNTTIIPDYIPSNIMVEKKGNYEVALVADLREDDMNLKNMIEDFINMFPYKVTVINIREFPFSGGCLGCFNCAGDGKCIYKNESNPSL